MKTRIQGICEEAENVQRKNEEKVSYSINIHNNKYKHEFRKMAHVK